MGGERGDETGAQEMTNIGILLHKVNKRVTREYLHVNSAPDSLYGRELVVTVMLSFCVCELLVTAEVVRIRLGTTVLAEQCSWDRLVGLVVKASASRAEDPGVESR